MDEAKLIFYGVKQSLPNFTNNYLTMDIGGGSIEFILANSNSVIWAQRFNIGVSLLKNLYHTTEPIAQQQIEAFFQFILK